MDLTAQLYFFSILVLANGHLSLGLGPPEHRDPGPPDLFDPLHLNSGRSLFNHYPPGPGFEHHHRDHGLLEDFMNPLFEDSEENIEGRYNQKGNIRVTTDRAPLKVNLLPVVHNNNTDGKKDINKPLGDKDNVIPVGNKNTQSVQDEIAPSKDEQNKNLMPPTLPAQDEHNVTQENKNILPPTLPAKEEPILRTNENRTITPEPIGKQILNTNNNEIIPLKINGTEENTHSGDSIVFPDNVEEMKSKLKDANSNTNKSSDFAANNNNFNNSDMLNITKNGDGVVLPVQTVPVNPVQDTNGKFLLVPINLSGSSQNQALPITNDIFPSRAPMYTTVRPGQSLYTNIANAISSNVPSSGKWNNGNNNYYQKPSYSSVVNNPPNNNLNPNTGTYNPNLSSNTANSPVDTNSRQVSSNSVGIPTTMYNPIVQQPPTTNSYNNQPNYSNMKDNSNPTRNLQNNGLIQQTVPSTVPSYNSQNTIPNYNGNNGYTPLNVPNNNVQVSPNGQQFYVISNNQLNNNGQPIILNTLNGNAMNSNSNNGNNNQQYILLNVNQLNTPQNGQGKNIYALQNGQLVALVPVQVANGVLVNNNNVVNQMTPVNGNPIQQNTILPNTMNSQPNIVTTNTNSNQPNVILMNGNTPNGAILLNGQISNSNSQNTVPNSAIILNSQASNSNIQNSLPNGAIIINGQTNNLNGQNSLPNGAIILNAQTSTINGQNSVPNSPILLNTQNVLDNGQTPSANNGQPLYTMVTVPNNYVSTVGGSNQAPTSVNLVNTREKDDKDSSASGNNAT